MEVKSPCIGNCRINIRSGLCEGCARTAEEIKAWPTMAEIQKQQLLLIVKQREDELGMPE
jgi:hypothetical protein